MLIIFQKYSIKNFIKIFLIQIKLLDSIREEEKFKKITDSSNLVTKTPIIIKDDEIEPSQIYKLNDTGLVEKLN